MDSVEHPSSQFNNEPRRAGTLFIETTRPSRSSSTYSGYTKSLAHTCESPYSPRSPISFARRRNFKVHSSRSHKSGTSSGGSSMHSSRSRRLMSHWKVMKKIASVNEGQMTKHMRTLERLVSSNDLESIRSEGGKHKRRPPSDRVARRWERYRRGDSGGSFCNKNARAMQKELATKAEFAKWLKYTSNSVFPRFEKKHHLKTRIDRLFEKVVSVLVHYLSPLFYPLMIFVLRWVNTIRDAMHQVAAFTGGVYVGTYFGAKVFPSDGFFGNLLFGHFTLPPTAGNYKYVKTKRIVFGGGAGLLFYEAGFAMALKELYGDQIADCVCFEGVSAGAFAAWVLISAIKGFGCISEMVGFSIDGLITYVHEDNNGGIPWNCYSHMRDNCLKLYAMAERHQATKAAATGSTDTVGSVCENRLIMWHTDAFTLSAVPATHYPDALHGAEAFVGSCYIPLLVQWPRLWVRNKTPYMNCAVDGELALRVGDSKIFKPVHKDGKTIRTLYIETGPTYPKPPPDPNLRTIKLWKWDDYRMDERKSGMANPWAATDLYLRGYYTSKSRAAEIHEAVSWLLEDTDCSHMKFAKSFTL